MSSSPHWIDLEQLVLDTEGPQAGLGNVTLDVMDPRLDMLLEELRKAGQDPHPRADRLYTSRELDDFPWIMMVVATAGLSGGVNLRQPYDRTYACPTCGADATPTPR
jgi:hypothetical protein